ncbi:hypothetical protein HPB48_022112 [Haemaphysalis longicornis]|uniref:Uncharacterized protein n=1 Tax=Haemaphysalis longicornis TaxID=44386 RepID=A0A9J6GT21_HAELO|nr:hypothetical protein HPB48_022112 [Haemaphysalis longicornis]
MVSRYPGERVSVSFPTMEANADAIFFAALQKIAALQSSPRDLSIQRRVLLDNLLRELPQPHDDEDSSESSSSSDDDSGEESDGPAASTNGPGPSKRFRPFSAADQAPVTGDAPSYGQADEEASAALKDHGGNSVGGMPYPAFDLPELLEEPVLPAFLSLLDD